MDDWVSGFAQRADRPCLSINHHELKYVLGPNIQVCEDALMALELGADVVMITAAIYQQGSALVAKIRDALLAEMTIRELLSLDELTGSQSSGFNPSPEHARRQAYSASIAEFLKHETISTIARLGKSPDD